MLQLVKVVAGRAAPFSIVDGALGTARRNGDGGVDNAICEHHGKAAGRGDHVGVTEASILGLGAASPPLGGPLLDPGKSITP